MSERTKDVIGLVFRLVLAGILGFAGLTKIFEPDGAKIAVMAYRVFPVEWTGFLGWALPALEILLAVLLLVGLFTRWAALVSGLLMVAFIIGIASVWIRGYSIDWVFRWWWGCHAGRPHVAVRLGDPARPAVRGDGRMVDGPPAHPVVSGSRVGEQASRRRRLL